jgi:hypothetical protein
MRKILTIAVVILLLVVTVFAWNTCAPNALYRVPHWQATELSKPKSSITDVVDELGGPYRRTPNAIGGESLIYRTVEDLGKFQLLKRLRIETDKGGMIIETEVWEEER